MLTVHGFRDPQRAGSEQKRMVRQDVQNPDITADPVAWDRVRRRVLVLLRDEALTLPEIFAFFAEDDHRFIGPAVGFHRDSANVEADTRHPNWQYHTFRLTAQGVRLAWAQ